MAQATKITAPNQRFSGTVAGVRFMRGVGYVNPDDLGVENVINYFQRHGYDVEGIDSSSVPLVSETFTAGEEAFVSRARPAEDAAVTEGLDDETRARLTGGNVGPLIDPAKSPTSAPLIGPSPIAGGLYEETPAGEKVDPADVEQPAQGVSVAGLPVRKRRDRDDSASGEDRFASMSKEELEAEAESRDLPKSGTKAEIADRLRSADSGGGE